MKIHFVKYHHGGRKRINSKNIKDIVTKLVLMYSVSKSHLNHPRLRLLAKVPTKFLYLSSLFLCVLPVKHDAIKGKSTSFGFEMYTERYVECMNTTYITYIIISHTLLYHLNPPFGNISKTLEQCWIYRHNLLPFAMPWSFMNCGITMNLLMAVTCRSWHLTSTHPYMTKIVDPTISWYLLWTGLMMTSIGPVWS